MNKLHEWINTGLILLVFVSGLVGGNQSASLGGVTNYDTVGASGLQLGANCNDSYKNCTPSVTYNSSGFSIGSGSTGTALTRVNTGTCYILPYAATIAASSTAVVDCQGTAAIFNTNTTLATALTGVTNGDNVIANFSTTTATTVSNGIVVTGAAASTTAGYITLTVSNLRGTTFTWPVTGSATGTVYYMVTK
jgi:hypothetical protein